MRMVEMMFRLAIPGLCTGCAATMLAGSAIRSGQKDIDFVLGPGVTAGQIQSRTKVAIALSGVNAANGQYVVATWAGDANASVYSDMLAMELLKLGYEANATTDVEQEGLGDAARARLRARGYDLLMVGNLNLAMTTNYASGMFGGEYARTGVTSATVRGVDPANGRTLFILSIQYGTAKNAGTVATDIGVAFQDALAGRLEPATGARSSGRAVAERAPPPPSTEPAESAPTAPPLPPSGTSRGTLPAPSLVGPGGPRPPGESVTTDTLTLRWSGVPGAIRYGVYIRDLTANRLVLTREDIEGTRLTLPAGLLQPGRSYRWNARGFSSSGPGQFAAPLYLRP